VTVFVVFGFVFVLNILVVLSLSRDNNNNKMFECMFDDRKQKQYNTRYLLFLDGSDSFRGFWFCFCCRLCFLGTS